MKLLNLSKFLFFALTGSLSAATIFRVEHYVAHSQSPFAAGIATGDILFNNFEPGSPGLVMPGLVMPFPMYTGNSGSIDEDDGVIDGIGGGTTLRSRVTSGPRFVFNFTPDALGRLPRYFGIAFPRPVSSDTNPQRAEEVIGATDAFGVNILTNYVFPTPEGTFPEESAEWGIFFGFYNEAGISQVTLKNAFWVDHLQFGYNVPEPGWLWVPAMFALALQRRRAPAGTLR